MKDIEQYTTVVDDFQHQIENKIRNHHDEAGFPQPSDEARAQFDDYLFDYQAAIDSEGSEKTRYTVAGILLILPILVISAFPEESLPFKGFMNVLCALGIGLVLFAIYSVIMKIMVKKKCKAARNNYPEAAAYVDRVEAYNL